MNPQRSYPFDMNHYLFSKELFSNYIYMDDNIKALEKMKIIERKCISPLVEFSKCIEQNKNQEASIISLFFIYQDSIDLYF